MAAGLGFKDFTTGEVLTAADVDGYLMQGIWVFADATARDAAVTSPQEGNFAFLKDTNVTTYYTGSAWTNLDTTGMVNPMTTTGDTIYSSSGSTPARLGIGTAGQILQVNSGATAPEWATPAVAGGMTLINTGGTTLTGGSVTISSIPATYKNLQLVIRNYKPTGDNEYLWMRFNGDSNTRYKSLAANASNSSYDTTIMQLSTGNDNSVADGLIVSNIYDYANTATWKMQSSYALENNSTTTANLNFRESSAFYNQTAAISSITLGQTGVSFTSGTAFLYGVS